MKNQRKLIVFAACTILLGAISPSIAAAKTILAEEKSAKQTLETMKRAIKKSDAEYKNFETKIRSLKIGEIAYTDEANATVELPEKATEPIVIEDLSDAKNKIGITLPSEFALTKTTVKMKDMAIYSSTQHAQLGLQNTE
ncbi:MAG: hypothetical protein LBS28_04185 [Streptococcaceae bacterium]|jgi:hypothetical protein|nr:hypothetical protein [Streptococcaceae bacterium]